MKDFKPISLCNVTYNVIIGLLSLRIRPYISKLKHHF